MNKRAYILILFLLQSCVEPVSLSPKTYENLLVVDGMLTNEMKQHQITLSRTTNLNDSKFLPEKGALIFVKGSDGITTYFNETTPGIYKTPYSAGTIGLDYVLHITTSDGAEYTSEKVTLNDAPPIQNIYAQYVSGSKAGPGIQIYLDTEDPQRKVHYYRWEYEGTYEIRTPFPSKFVWTGGNTLTYRTVAVDNCWASDSSKNVLIHSTAGFIGDKVVAFPLKFIKAESPDLVIKYSILAKQYTLSEKSYFFWKQLKEVNEEQGTLFDKQVGTIVGNIAGVNNKNRVLGYFDASAVSMKRAFFTPQEFKESGYTPPLYLQSCVETFPVTIPIEKLGETMEEYSASLIIADVGGDGPSVVFLMRIACCDCTSRGTNIKPAFWE